MEHSKRCSVLIEGADMFKFLLLFMCVFAFAAAGAEQDMKSAVAERLASKPAPVLGGKSSAADVLKACRAMLPKGRVELAGAIVLRNRKGIVINEYDYKLVMNRSVAPAKLSVQFSTRGGTNILAEAVITRPMKGEPVIELADKDGTITTPSIIDSVMDTDVTWLDMTLDFLWWLDPVFEEEKESETVHGQKCAVILVAPPAPVKGMAAVRLWADKKTGCLMQAEQLGETMEPIRRMWGTRVKKFGERWMVSVLEVETLGSGHRTKIIVKELR